MCEIKFLYKKNTDYTTILQNKNNNSYNKGSFQCYILYIIFIYKIYLHKNKLTKYIILWNIKINIKNIN